MHETTETFIEQLSLHLEDYGFSKIAGRMLGYFLVAGGMHALGELAECLQVSKGSVSTNARLLEQRGLLTRCSRPGDRRDFYCLADDPWRSIFEVSRNRMRAMGNLFEETARGLPSEMEEAQERLTHWKDFHHFLLEDMDRRIARWEEHEARTTSSE